MFGKKSNLIIIKLQGGLGNQMFQYAFGRNLAIKNNADLKLDISFFEGQQLREYMLKHFSIKATIATADECNSFRNVQFSKWATTYKKILGTLPTVFEERQLLFDPEYLKIKSNVYLTGYFQSEQYFQDISEKIITEFQIKTAPSIENRNMLAVIADSNAISLHIRRGDYVADSAIHQIHGTCNSKYYDDAVNLIVKRVQLPVFFVFSDDISWARKHFRLLYPVHFVDINDERSSFEDLRLMQHCKHHILANSTFSWWGAWLNGANDKIVIAPDKWFNDPAMNLQAGSLLPEKWIKL